MVLAEVTGEQAMQDHCSDLTYKVWYHCHWHRSMKTVYTGDFFGQRPHANEVKRKVLRVSVLDINGSGQNIEG